MATRSTMTPEDLEYHRRTFTWFARGVFIVAGHALVILMILGWVFSGSLG